MRSEFTEEGPNSGWTRRPRGGHGPHMGGGGPQNWHFAAREGRRGGRPPLDDLEDLIALRRMWKGGPMGGPGWGPHRHGRGRARRGDVRLALLRLLSEEPRNGYRLMQDIEERSGGLWRPSPGSVYPTLTQLEDEGFVRTIESEAGRRYEITDAGRQHLDQRRDEPDPWAETAKDNDNPIAELAPLAVQIIKATLQVASVGNRSQRDRARSLLSDTRRSLYRILAEDDDAEERPEA